MIPDDQPTVPTRPPNPSNASQPGVWVAPTVEELQAKLPQYEVLEILGRGGMGAVYKARQKSLKRLVAIKILPLGMADDEFKFVERFQNEAQTMAQMNHPAIVSVYDFGETSDGLLYFVMEFVDGTDVHRMIQASGRLSGEYALAITAHVCDALSYAHKRGVIHRDIKPANILIDQEGHIKVADFGLAKMNDPAQTSGLTKTNMAMGTPDYVAPEVLTTGMVADHRADIYAVGVMLYQMLTGEVPRGLFKMPSHRGIGTDERFDAIICKAMEQDREERYQSAMDVRRDLDVILTTPQPKNDGTGIVPASELPQKPVAKQPRPPGQQNAPAQNQPPAKGAAKQAPEQKAAAAATAKAPPKKQSPAAMWMSIGGIVAVLAIAGFLVLGGKPKTTGDATSSKASTSLASQPQSPIKVRDGGSSPSSSQSVGKTVDLLPLVDVKRDVIAGEWMRDGDDLVVNQGNTGPEGTPRLQLPYQPPEEYDFEVEFTPKAGTNLVAQVVSAQEHSFAWMLDAMLALGNKAGFDRIDGQGISSRAIGTTMRKSFLENGRRHRSTVEVRKTEVRGLLDGEVIVKWAKNVDVYKAFDSSPAEAMRDSLHLGLAVRERAVRFHKITVREITGTGKVDAEKQDTVASRPDLPPQIKAWRDVTAEAREKAKAFSELAVTDKGIENQANRSNPRLYLTSPGQRDQAVRMRFTGYGQVDLHVCDAGFLYVMVQPVQTIFHSQARGSSIPPVKLIPSKLHPPGYDPKQPHELLVTIEGTRLRAWLDGKFVGEAKADAYTEGATGVIITPATILHQVELGEFAETVTSGPPNMNWQDVTSTLRDAAKAKPGFAMDGDLIIWTGDNKNPPHFTVTPAGLNDYSLRLTHVGAGQINVRMNEKGFVYVQAAAGGFLINRWMKGVTAPVTLLKRQPIPFSYSKGEPHDLTVNVQGSTIRAWLDGQPMGTVDDTMFATGTGAVALMSSSKVKKVEVAEIDNAKKANASTEVPPNITNWQDVTSTMRETMRSKPGISVEAHEVRRTSNDGGVVNAKLSNETTRDRFLRVRFTHNVQISLWSTMATGSAAVLVLSNRTVFQRQVTAAGSAERFGPDMPHPSGYDIFQPHELIVAVQGSTVRTWLDGRFTGEAKDDLVEGRFFGLGFFPQTAVQKVEVAELPAASSSTASSEPTWQPIFNQPSEFNGDSRDVEFRDGATFIKARTFLAPADPAIVGIRSTMRYLEGDRTGSLTLRSTEGAKYGEEDFALTAYIAPKGTSLVVKMRDRPAGIPAGIDQLGRHDYPLSPALKEGDLFTFELRAENKKIIVSINGHEIGSLDDAWKGATRRFGITPSVNEMTEFRNVAVRRAPKAP